DRRCGHPPALRRDRGGYQARRRRDGIQPSARSDEARRRRIGRARAYRQREGVGEGQGRGRMSARVLDGQALARAMQEEIRDEVAAFTAQHGRPPGLGIVLVGDNPASEIYVRNKLKTGGEIGFRADLERLPASATLADTLALVERLNRSDAHDGILVQSPLPKAMGADAEQRVFDSIAP